MHPGQLRLNLERDSFVGAGGFKTAYTATLLLSELRQAGVGSKPCKNIIVKRPYVPPEAGRPNKPPYKRLGVREESEKLYREANVLYWAKSLFQVVDDFVANALAKSTEAPPFRIPSVRFVDAGLAFRYSPGPAKVSKALSVDCAYLCEEEIEDARDRFTKFIHNGSCVPLLEPGEIGYDVAQFLAFSQHVQYVETEGLAYISDYQGTPSLLTDPQVLTHPSIGHNLFCEGNLEMAVERFPKEHVCNRFCKWPGFKLAPFRRGEGKGKGKALDPVVVDSD